MMLHTLFPHLKRTRLLWSLPLLLLLNSACSPAAAPAPELLSDLVALTPTPTQPPPTRVATLAPAQPEADSSTSLNLSDPDEEAEETGNLTLAVEATATPVPPAPQTGELTTWTKLIPPPGWEIAQGVNGLLVVKDATNMPQEPFVLVRRWSNQLTLDDWVAYLPDGIEERNSDVEIRLGGLDWDGVFVSNADSDYRAFFAVARKEVPAYSLLVYVPSTAAADFEDRRAALLNAWEADVIELNSILNRFEFSY